MASAPCRAAIASDPDGHGRRGVARAGLEHEEVAAGGAAAAVLVARGEEVLAVGDGDDLRHVTQRQQAVQRLLQQAAAVGQLDEGLGIGFARHGPQARAAAAGKDEGDQHG